MGYLLVFLVVAMVILEGLSYMLEGVSATSHGRRAGTPKAQEGSKRRS